MRRRTMLRNMMLMMMMMMMMNKRVQESILVRISAPNTAKAEETPAGTTQFS